MFHVVILIICINFSFAIVRGLDIFHIVPTEETATYASYGVGTVAYVSGIVFGGGIAAAIAGLLGYRIPLGAIAYSVVFGISAIPLSGTLNDFAIIDGWPGGLNTAILGLVGFIYVWGFIQLASVGGKVVE